MNSVEELQEIIGSILELEEVVDQQIHFQAFEELWRSGIADPQVIRKKGI